MIVVFLSAGCVAHRQVVNSAHTNPELEQAYRDMANGKYISAVPKYLWILQQKESTPGARQEARFRLGECYYHMRSYMESGIQFQRYLADYSDGAFASDAKQYLEKLQGIESQERQREELRRKEAEARLKHWRDMAKREPKSAEAAAQVGHALWDLGDYEDAAREYLRALQLDPGKRYDELISSRLEFHEDGSATVITPEERERLEKERNPIVIYNKHAYRAGGQDLFASEPRYFIVTGQVVNRSSRVVQDVEVAVTIFDFAGHVLDSASYRMGTMRAGRIRSFTVRFSNFENIYNIDRYECESVYE